MKNRKNGSTRVDGKWKKVKVKDETNKEKGTKKEKERKKERKSQ